LPNGTGEKEATGKQESPFSVISGFVLRAAGVATYEE
jgi:hypothetical protein